MSYRSSHVGTGRGESYDTTFEDGCLGHLWREVERPLVVSKLAGLRDAGASSVLDFACGTGRITQLNEELFADSYAVDVSRDMLREAERRCSATQFFLADLTLSTPADLPLVDLVTAFRFFVNAEDSLRVDVLAALRQQLRPGGHLVVNVQWNAASLSGAIYGTRNRLRGVRSTTASFGGMAKLLKRSGFRVVDRTGYGVLPWLGGRFDISSAASVARVEEAGRKVPLFDRFLQHFLIVAERT